MTDLIAVHQLKEPSPLIGWTRQFTLCWEAGPKETPKRSVRVVYFSRVSRNRRASWAAISGSSISIQEKTGVAQMRTVRISFLWRVQKTSLLSSQYQKCFDGAYHSCQYVRQDTTQRKPVIVSKNGTMIHGTVVYHRTLMTFFVATCHVLDELTGSHMDGAAPCHSQSSVSFSPRGYDHWPHVRTCLWHWERTEDATRQRSRCWSLWIWLWRSVQILAVDSTCPERRPLT